MAALKNSHFGISYVTDGHSSSCTSVHIFNPFYANPFNRFRIQLMLTHSVHPQLNVDVMGKYTYAATQNPI